MHVKTDESRRKRILSIFTLRAIQALSSSKSNREYVRVHLSQAVKKAETDRCA